MTTPTNTPAWQAVTMYRDCASFLNIRGSLILTVGELGPTLRKRAIVATKRGFSTASQGPTRKLIDIVAKHAGYNDHGFSYSSWSNILLYAPSAVGKEEFKDVADGIEALMNLEGTARLWAHRDSEVLMLSASASLNRESKKRLRAFVKQQMARWMIYRQPMLDFLEDPARTIVWEFDSAKQEYHK